jgi:coiled-coil domain-containing protein 130
MSSLAAVQADGYYYPPDWTPDGGSASLRARVGTKGAKGALGKKNAKLKPKQPTVRFEMPFDVGCSRCDATIGKGVRFNAAKTAVGTYHSTTVWAFEMKTACCGNHLEIRTDPENGDFALVNGAARRRLGGAAAEGAMEVELLTREDRELLMADGMARLDRAAVFSAEHRDDEAFSGADARLVGEARQKKTLCQKRRDDGHSRWTTARHAELRATSTATWRDDYDANRSARRVARAERNRIARDDAERAAIGLPESVALLPKNEDDAETARRAFRGGRDVFTNVTTRTYREGSTNDVVDDRRQTRGPKRKNTDRTHGAFDAFDAFDAFERHRAFRRATIRESSVFSGPGAAARGYVPTPSAAARAGGARGVQARHALAVARKASAERSATNGASVRARAAALAARSAGESRG